MCLPLSFPSSDRSSGSKTECYSLLALYNPRSNIKIGNAFVIQSRRSQMGNHFCFGNEDRPVEPKTRTYHGRVGARRRTARRHGKAGTGRTKRRKVGSPRRHPSLFQFRRMLSNGLKGNLHRIRKCSGLGKLKPET